MFKSIETLMKYLDAIRGEESVVQEKGEGFVVELNDKVVTIDGDGTLHERLRPVPLKRSAKPIHVTAACGQQSVALPPTCSAVKPDSLIPEYDGAVDESHTSLFVEADYPRLLSLVEQKAVFELDFEARYNELMLEDYVEWDERPNYHDFTWPVMAGGQPGGHYSVGASQNNDSSLSLMERIKADAVAVRSKFRMLDDVGFELTYYPMHPSISRLAPRDFFDSTRLAEAMTFEEFRTELQADAEWLRAVTSDQGIFECVFEVFPAGGNEALRMRNFEESEQYFGDLAFEEPLTVKAAGKEFKFYVWQHED